MNALTWIISPTRATVDLLKTRFSDRAYRGRVLRRWSFGLFAFEVVLALVLVMEADARSAGKLTFPAAGILYYACSRIAEIAYAFYRDPLSPEKESDLTAVDRLRMAMRSYLGLVLNFAILYYFIPLAGMFDGQGTKGISIFGDALYFSAVTITTVGYGDIVPVSWVARLLSLVESGIGLLVLVVAIGTYIGGIGMRKSSEEESGRSRPVNPRCMSIRGMFSRRSPASFDEKVGIPPGWFVVSWAWMPDKRARRKAHGRWYRISSETGSVCRVLRFSGSVRADPTAETGTVVIDWPAWLELSNYAEETKAPLKLRIEPVPRWWFWTMALSHPDPIYRLAGALGLTSLILGVLSLGLSAWSVYKVYVP